MWWLFAMANALFMSLTNVFTRLSSGRVNPVLGAAVTLSVGAILVAGVSIITSKSTVSGEGLVYPALAGMFTGLGMMAWFLLFSSGASLSAGGIVAILGVIGLTALWGMVVFKEPVTATKIMGLALAMVAAWLLNKLP